MGLKLHATYGTAPLLMGFAKRDGSDGLWQSRWSTDRMGCAEEGMWTVMSEDGRGGMSDAVAMGADEAGDQLDVEVHSGDGLVARGSVPVADLWTVRSPGTRTALCHRNTCPRRARLACAIEFLGFPGL